MLSVTHCTNGYEPPPDGGDEILNVIVAVALSEAEFIARMVTTDPLAVDVGVPLTTPVAEFKVKDVGRVPLITEYVIGVVVKFVGVKAVVGVIALPVCPVTV